MDVCQELGRITSNNPSAMENLKQLRRSKQAEEAENIAGMKLLGILWLMNKEETNDERIYEKASCFGRHL